jgi:hypothetical protein
MAPLWVNGFTEKPQVKDGRLIRRTTAGIRLDREAAGTRWAHDGPTAGKRRDRETAGARLVHDGTTVGIRLDRKAAGTRWAHNT